MRTEYYFAATTEYNCDAYGAGDYNECNATQGASTQPSTPSESGPLAYTGYDVIVPVALGLAVVGASVILLVKKLRRRSS